MQTAVYLGKCICRPITLGYNPLTFGVRQDAEEKLVGQVFQRDAVRTDTALYGHVGALETSKSTTRVLRVQVGRKKRRVALPTCDVPRLVMS